MGQKLEERLRTAWRQIIPHVTIGLEDSAFDLGANSLQVLMLVAASSEVLRIDIDLDAFFTNPTMAYLLKQHGKNTANKAKPEEAVQEIPLLPAQRWLLSSGSNLNQWWTGLLLTAHQVFDTVLLRVAVEACAQRHAALRCTFSPDDRAARVAATPHPGVFTTLDLRNCPLEHRQRVLEWFTLRENNSVDLENGPLFSLAYIHWNDAEVRLFLRVHHLISDGYSNGVVLREIIDNYRNLAAGSKVRAKLPTSVGEIAGHRRQFADTFMLPNSFTQALDSYHFVELPKDFRPSPVSNRGIYNSALVHTLSVQQADQLEHLAKEADASIIDVFMWALARTLCKWTADNHVRIVNIDAGRRSAGIGSLDSSETVGWLSVLSLLVFEINSQLSLIQQVQLVHRQRCNAPLAGAWFDDYRERSDWTYNIAPQEMVIFNFQGNVDQLLQLDRLKLKIASEKIRKAPATDTERQSCFYIDVRRETAGMKIAWHFSRALHLDRTIETLMKDFLDHLAGASSGIGMRRLITEPK